MSARRRRLLDDRALCGDHLTLVSNAFRAKKKRLVNCAQFDTGAQSLAHFLPNATHFRKRAFARHTFRPRDRRQQIFNEATAAVVGDASGGGIRRLNGRAAAATEKEDEMSGKLRSRLAERIQCRMAAVRVVWRPLLRNTQCEIRAHDARLASLTAGGGRL